VIVKLYSDATPHAQELPVSSVFNQRFSRLAEQRVILAEPKEGMGIKE
jgi:hypothetical protein